MAEFQGPSDDLAQSLETLKRRLNQKSASLNAPQQPRLPLPPLTAQRISGPSRKPGSRRVLLFGGIAAFLHLGFKDDGDPSHPGSVTSLAESVAKASHTGRSRLDAIGRAKPGAVELAGATSNPSFSTDFSEPEALSHWWQLESDGLLIEPFEKRMSAVPRGPSLAKPTRTMSNGQAFFHFVQQNRQAGFILRGQDERDCYRVTYTPQKRAGRPEMVLSARRRRRGVEHEIARRVVTDLAFTGLTRQHISVEMDGPQFAARLHWVESSRIPGWPSANRELVIATWRDEVFTDGAVGVWGPDGPPSTAGEFRLLTVAAEV